MKSDLERPGNDLELRTFEFAKSIVIFCKSIEQNSINKPIISQLVRSSTSVGANYTEAQNASSRKDFKNKIYICKKEIAETKYWLNLLEGCGFQNMYVLKSEAQELTLIFGKIIAKLNKVQSMKYKD